MSGNESNELDLRIWQVVALIPRGRVASYGDVAAQAGVPGAARRVGAALRKLPTGSKIPWHRVVNAAGGISFPENSSGHRTQRERLEKEGLQFKANGKLDLRAYRGFSPRDKAVPGTQRSNDGGKPAR